MVLKMLDDFDYLHSKKDNINGEKIIIGQGTFGKVRLCINIIEPYIKFSLAPGTLMCVKKTHYIGEYIKDKN